MSCSEKDIINVNLEITDTVPLLIGPQGDKGSKGLSGDSGAQGTTGIMGETGIQGNQGYQGSQGLPGTPGETGIQGPQGDQGDQGRLGLANTWFILDLGSTGYTGAIVPNPTGHTGHTGLPTTLSTGPSQPESSILRDPIQGDYAIDLSSCQIYFYETNSSPTGWQPTGQTFPTCPSQEEITEYLKQLEEPQNQCALMFTVTNCPPLFDIQNPTKIIEHTLLNQSTPADQLPTTTFTTPQELMLILGTMGWSASTLGNTTIFVRSDPTTIYNPTQSTNRIRFHGTILDNTITQHLNISCQQESCYTCPNLNNTNHLLVCRGETGSHLTNSHESSLVWVPANCFSIYGNTGAMGYRGPTGTQGPKGNTGILGYTGPKGPTASGVINCVLDLANPEKQASTISHSNQTEFLATVYQGTVDPCFLGLLNSLPDDIPNSNDLEAPYTISFLDNTNQTIQTTTPTQIAPQKFSTKTELWVAMAILQLKLDGNLIKTSQPLLTPKPISKVSFINSNQQTLAHIMLHPVSQCPPNTITTRVLTKANNIPTTYSGTTGACSSTGPTEVTGLQWLEGSCTLYTELNNFEEDIIRLPKLNPRPQNTYKCQLILDATNPFTKSPKNNNFPWTINEFIIFGQDHTYKYNQPNQKINHYNDFINLLTKNGWNLNPASISDYTYTKHTSTPPGSTNQPISSLKMIDSMNQVFYCLTPISETKEEVDIHNNLQLISKIGNPSMTGATGSQPQAIDCSCPYIFTENYTGHHGFTGIFLTPATQIFNAIPFCSDVTYQLTGIINTKDIINQATICKPWSLKELYLSKQPQMVNTTQFTSAIQFNIILESMGWTGSNQPANTYTSYTTLPISNQHSWLVLTNSAGHCQTISFPTESESICDLPECTEDLPNCPLGSNPEPTSTGPTGLSSPTGPTGTSSSATGATGLSSPTGATGARCRYIFTKINDDMYCWMNPRAYDDYMKPEFICDRVPLDSTKLNDIPNCSNPPPMNDDILPEYDITVEITKGMIDHILWTFRKSVGINQYLANGPYWIYGYQVHRCPDEITKTLIPQPFNLLNLAQALVLKLGWYVSPDLNSITSDTEKITLLKNNHHTMITALQINLNGENGKQPPFNYNFPVYTIERTECHDLNLNSKVLVRVPCPPPIGSSTGPTGTSSTGPTGTSATGPTGATGEIIVCPEPNTGCSGHYCFMDLHCLRPTYPAPPNLAYELTRIHECTCSGTGTIGITGTDCYCLEEHIYIPGNTGITGGTGAVGFTGTSYIQFCSDKPVFTNCVSLNDCDFDHIAEFFAPETVFTLIAYRTVDDQDCQITGSNTFTDKESFRTLLITTLDWSPTGDDPNYLCIQTCKNIKYLVFHYLGGDVSSPPYPYLIPVEVVGNDCPLLNPENEILIRTRQDCEVDNPCRACEVCWTHLCEIPGLRGIQGEEGNDGLGGLHGESGPQGITGPFGGNGDQGPQGPSGTKGETGLRGNLGFRGNQGGVGDDGERGPQGNIGVTGPEGITGGTGHRGEFGNDGDDGERGHQGDIGDAINTGVRGPQGKDGLPGDNGVQGVTNATGPQGETGYQGYQGYQGYPGFEGDEGDEGERGTQGYRGYQGDGNIGGEKGAQGYQGINNLTTVSSLGLGESFFRDVTSTSTLRTLNFRSLRAGENIIVTSNANENFITLKNQFMWDNTVFSGSPGAQVTSPSTLTFQPTSTLYVSQIEETTSDAGITIRGNTTLGPTGEVNFKDGGVQFGNHIPTIRGPTQRPNYLSFYQSGEFTTDWMRAGTANGQDTLGTSTQIYWNRIGNLCSIFIPTLSTTVLGTIGASDEIFTTTSLPAEIRPSTSPNPGSQQHIHPFVIQHNQTKSYPQDQDDHRIAILRLEDDFMAIASNTKGDGFESPEEISQTLSITFTYLIPHV